AVRKASLSSRRTTTARRPSWALPPDRRRLSDHERSQMRFAFLGLGRASRLYHLPALKQIDGVTAGGGFDAVASQREAWRTQTGLPAYESVDELLEREKPDVVVVATPPDSHADLAVQALSAGAHVV